jgi:hypothetical protein
MARAIDARYGPELNPDVETAVRVLETLAAADVPAVAGTAR